MNYCALLKTGLWQNKHYTVVRMGTTKVNNQRPRLAGLSIHDKWTLILFRIQINHKLYNYKN